MTGVSEKALNAARLVLAKCSAIDPWFPQPSESTMLGWAQQFGLVNLDTQDLLDAVTSVYANATSGFKPLPADVVNAARVARQDRMARAIEPAREALDPGRVAEHVAEITATLGAKFNRPSRRPGANPLTVRCPWCHASPGQHCTVPQTNRRPHGGAHPSRLEAAEAIRHTVSGGAHANNP